MRKQLRTVIITFVLCSLCVGQIALAQEEDPIGRQEIFPDKVVWTPTRGEYSEVILRVLCPFGKVFERVFRGGEEIFFHAEGMEDGVYNWELIAEPIFSDSIVKALKRAREEGNEDDVAKELLVNGKLNQHAITQAGHFEVSRGFFSPNDLVEKDDQRLFRTSFRNTTIDMSLCVGFDCPNNPSYGFTTLLMMENNLRIKFDDTSTAASFPRNDWSLEANDSANGGASRFMIKDCGVTSQGNCSGDIVFAVEAGAPNGALYVDDGGRVGISTTTPTVELHIRNGDTPTVRLDQAGGGFAPQIWDVAGNESNFFIRDVTNGSTLPLRIRPGAPTSSIDVSGDGFVGVGTSSPDRKLHVLGNDAQTADDNEIQVRVQNDSGTEGNRAMVYLRNNGGSAVYYEDTSSSLIWQTLAQDSNFFISRLGSGGSEFTLTDTGNLTITGTLTEMSDRNAKRNIVPVDSDAVLQRVSALPISAWSYKTDPTGVRHIGPMAQDFHAAFGLGQDDRHIATMDTSGVALAAIQALHRNVQDKDDEIAQLKARLSQLEALVADLSNND